MQVQKPPAPGGSGSKLFSLRGELKIEGEGRPQDYTAEIEPCRRQIGSLKTSIRPNGQFEFRGLEADCYVVRLLLGPQGKAVQQMTTQVGSETQVGFEQVAVRFVLRPEAQTQPAAGYVALQELASPPSKKAVKAFQHAQKDAREGKLKQAAEQYRQILQSEPKYAEAHQELGALYLQMGQAEPARAEFVAARGLGLESPAVLGSLALALLQLGRVEESEAAAREALAKEPTNAPANYALGSALLFHSTDYPLILEHLARAAEQIPSARLLTAKVRAKTGDIKGAIQDLTEYLRVCPADKRAAAEGMLRELQAQLVAARR
jgi:tetratricopeptide (TPR) repeat protein